MAKVRVPRTPKKAFDRTRRPSTLLLGQIEHLEWAVLPASQRKPDQLPARKVKTEAQAAERVAQLTGMLQKARAAEAAAPPAPVILPPLPIAVAQPGRRLAQRTRKATPSARRRSSRR